MSKIHECYVYLLDIKTLVYKVSFVYQTDIKRNCDKKKLFHSPTQGWI